MAVMTLFHAEKCCCLVNTHISPNPLHTIPRNFSVDGKLPQLVGNKWL